MSARQLTARAFVSLSAGVDDDLSDSTDGFNDDLDRMERNDGAGNVFHSN